MFFDIFNTYLLTFCQYSIIFQHNHIDIYFFVIWGVGVLNPYKVRFHHVSAWRGRDILAQLHSPLLKLFAFWLRASVSLFLLVPVWQLRHGSFEHIFIGCFTNISNWVAQHDLGCSRYSCWILLRGVGGVAVLPYGGLFRLFPKKNKEHAFILWCWVMKEAWALRY